MKVTMFCDVYSLEENANAYISAFRLCGDTPAPAHGTTRFLFTVDFPFVAGNTVDLGQAIPVKEREDDKG